MPGAACAHEKTGGGEKSARKVIKIVAIRLKCIKSFVGKGSAPDPTGELTALP